MSSAKFDLFVLASVCQHTFHYRAMQWTSWRSNRCQDPRCHQTRWPLVCKCSPVHRVQALFYPETQSDTHRSNIRSLILNDSKMCHWKFTDTWYLLTHYVLSAPLILGDIGSGNGLSPDRRQTTAWTNDDPLPIKTQWCFSKLH